MEPQVHPCAPVCSCEFYALALHLHPTFIAPFQSKVYLEPSQTSVVELFCKNRHCLKAVCYFCKKAPLWMFNRVLNLTSPNNLL